jgi:hypothetical protein
VQLFINDEILAGLRLRGRPSGSIRCARTDAGTLFALASGARDGAAELYPQLQAARDARHLYTLPFALADIAEGPGPWVLQPARSLVAPAPKSRLVAELRRLPHLPADYQPYLETMLERGQNGLLVVGAEDAMLIRRRACHGHPDAIWVRLPMSTTPVLLPSVGESPLVSGKRFVLIGAGSLGSRAAELLAAAGAAEIVLVDHDVLEPRNLRRHLCGVEHLGRAKAEAVAEALRERGFPTLVSTVQGRAQVELADQVRELIAKSDLVLCTTDSAPPRQFVNHTALHADVPSIIANVQLRPQPLAEIAVTIPGGGCWNCWRTQLEKDGVMNGAAGHDPADYPDADAPVPSGLPMYQLTAVAATACDLAGVALASEPQSMIWLMALDIDVADFPHLPKARESRIEPLKRLATCEVCAR